MADGYGVTLAEVAAVMPGLFREGFTASTKPSQLVVQGWINAADARVQLLVQRLAGVAPESSDTAALFAKQHIIMWTCAMVMRALYAGNAPGQVAEAANQFALPAAEFLTQLEALGAQTAGSGEVPNRVRGVDGSLLRELLITDDDLGFGAARSRRF
jgi:hypothetical protein